MTRILDDPLDTLRRGMTGTVIDPADARYDVARRVWNGAVDARPAVIALCASAEDVAAAVRFAVAEGLEVAVRGGGHSMSGASTVDDGLVIDLSGMRGVQVDAAARVALVEGGALLGDVDAATQAHGLAVPAGLVSHTGVAGLTLGGGMGRLIRVAGLTVDHLRAARLVTADGSIVRVSETEQPDLLWALRGGGGNFGVVIEFEFSLVPVEPMVRSALLFWGLERGPAMLRLCRDLVPELPRRLSPLILSMTAPPAPFVPPQHQGRPGWALELVGFGAPDEHDAALERIRTALPPDWEVVESVPYTALQSMFDDDNPNGQYAYDRSAYLDDLSDGAIAVLAEHVPGARSPESGVVLYRLDGAYSEVPDEATAFGGSRRPGYGVFVVAACAAAELLPDERAWVRGLTDALAPHARAGTYVNATAESPMSQVEASYGPAKWRRLREIKTRVDPANVFHRNHNIPPLD